jgi:multidrug efflux system membrane fusion protein
MIRSHARAFLLLIVFALNILAGCARAAARAAAAPPPKINVAEVISRDVTEWDEFTGRLEAVNTVFVRPRVSGYLSAVHFEEGGMVKNGDLLFEIDGRPFQAEVDRLRAELERAHATVQRATSELGRAERLSRAEAMATEERDRRSAFAKESNAQVAAVEAALRAAQLNLEFTSVRSPIDGRVGRAIVTVGNVVTNGPGEGTLLTTVVSLDPIYASFEVDEKTFLHYVDLASASNRASVRDTLPIQMALGSKERFPYQGRLHFLDNQINPATGTIRGRAIFHNRDFTLLPGTFVRLRLPGVASYRAALIQDRAVGTELDKRYVYVVGQGSIIESRAVLLGPVVDGLRVVRSGLQASDLVVVDGLQRVRPGAQIDPVKVSMDARP